MSKKLSKNVIIASSKEECNEKKTIFDVPEVRKILDKHSSTFTGSLDKKYENVKNILRIRKEATQNKLVFLRYRHFGYFSICFLFVFFVFINGHSIVEEQINEKDGIQKRLIQSDKALAELLQDGTELITNIRIANDRREIDRRINETAKRESLLQDLKTESIHAIAKFDLITSRWNELSLLKDPIALFEGLDYQKNKISDLMKQKDEIINNLHKNLQRTDERYYIDQEKQSFDIYCLVERIDAQVNVMKTAYRQHLELLQNTIDDERGNLRLSYSAKWIELYEYRTNNELDKIEKEKKQTEQYEIEMKKIALEHEELIRMTRIQLDQDNDNLLIELENVKAEVLLNTEKLDYNYQIIQKRADENIVIRNQQKRRLGKLHEIVINLKNKINETKCNGKQEIKKLRQEVMKLNENIMHLEEKSTNFAEINDKKVRLSFIYAYM